MKSLAKRKNYLTKRETELVVIPKTLRELLKVLVTNQVQEFNDKKAETNLVCFLTNADIQQQVQAGKVGFGAKYSDQKADLQKAAMTAIQAYEDGLYRVFINELEPIDLDQPLELKEGDHLTFIKLTMLAGRMW